MNIKKLFTQIFAICLATLTTVTTISSTSIPEKDNPPSGTVATPDLSLSARSAVLIDGDGHVLMAQNADTPLPMASTTKIMTALVALETMSLDSLIAIPAGAVGVEGSSIYLTPGEKLTLEELLYALMLESANDAAVAIAIAVAGSTDSFVDLMNKRAESLELQSTHFDNPHGLDSDTHQTTARELAIIAAEAFKNKDFCRIAGTYRQTIPMGGDGEARLLVNHNRLLRSYDGVIGGKTGFTKKSGRCLVTAAERDGLRLIAVTLSDPDDWRDHESMLDYGFAEYERVEICNERDCRFLVSLNNGEQRSIIVSNASAIRVTLPKSHGEITFFPSLPVNVTAPVRHGCMIGTVSWVCDGELIATTSLTAEYSAMAKKQNKMSLIERIKAFLGF